MCSWRIFNLNFQFLLFVSPRWKIHEACMLALGSVKSIITESVKNGRIQFDMHGFLASVVLADLNLASRSETECPTELNPHFMC